jgi:hypothetical protein
MGVLCCLLAANGSWAQCGPYYTAKNTLAMSYQVLKYPAGVGAGGCTIVGINNASCFPLTAGQFVGTLSAKATFGATNPSCMWMCACAAPGLVPVSINSSDGLPVELLEFEVEDGEPAEQEQPEENPPEENSDSSESE